MDISVQLHLQMILGSFQGPQKMKFKLRKEFIDFLEKKNESPLNLILQNSSGKEYKDLHNLI